MTAQIPRRNLLRTAGAVGAGAVAASAVARHAYAEGDDEHGNSADHRRRHHHHGRLFLRKEQFGTMPDGTAVDRYAFGTEHGLNVQMITWGARLQTVNVPDRHGRSANVICGRRTLEEYLTVSDYFGATIGRYGNRIANGEFTLDGTTYHLPVNNGPNTLHGGPEGFDTKVWDAEEVHDRDSVGVRYTYVSADGEEGFPGKLTTVVTYTVNRRDELTINYHATVEGKATVLNLTNHAYYNLAGEGSGTVYDQVAVINADSYLPTDDTQIPLGPAAPVRGTPFDFRRPHTFGERIRDGVHQIVLAHGYDHNWNLNRRAGSPPSFAARVRDPHSGRTVDCFTDQPGIQVYTGNYLDGTVVGTSGKTYRQGDAFTLETQHYPDSPNESSYPSTVLRPGQSFDSTSVFRFSAR